MAALDDVNDASILFSDAIIIEPQYEMSNSVLCATSKGSDQPAHARRLIRALLVA